VLSLPALTQAPPCRVRGADGILIYRLLGAETEAAFARSWGVSYGFNALSEWREVAKEALKSAAVLMILESLYLTRNVHWIEEQVDHMSLQALLFGRTGVPLGPLGRARLYFEFQRRLTD
jgi:hypothetical protein